jgi:GT2 family glycosyltransferase
MKISFIYVVYYQHDSLLVSLHGLIHSLIVFDVYNEYEVCVVDNSRCAFDRSKHSFSDWISAINHSFCTVPHARFNYIASPSNIGFSRACNVGFKNTSGKFRILVNCDVAFSDDFPSNFLKSLQIIDSAFDCFIAGPMLCGDISPFPSYLTYRSSVLFLAFKPLLRLPMVTCLRLPTYIRSWLSKRWTKNIARRRIGFPSSLQSIPVNWVSGAFMIIHQRFFEVFPGLDPRFFLYFEDVDICISVNRFQKKVLFFPFWHVLHAGSFASSSMKGIRNSLINNPAFVYHLCSWFLFVLKWRRPLTSRVSRKLRVYLNKSFARIIRIH